MSVTSIYGTAQNSGIYYSTDLGNAFVTSTVDGGGVCFGVQ